MRVLPLPDRRIIAIDGVVASFADISSGQGRPVTMPMRSSIPMREPFAGAGREPEGHIGQPGYSIKTFQVIPEDTEGQLIYALGNRQWDIPQLREMLKDVLEEDTVFDGYRVEHDFPGIGHRVMLLNARRVYEGASATQLILLAMEDISAAPSKSGVSDVA